MKYFDRFLTIFKDSVTVEPEVELAVGAAGSAIRINNDLLNMEPMTRKSSSRKRPAASAAMASSPSPKAASLTRKEMQLKHLENQTKLVSEFGLLLEGCD